MENRSRQGLRRVARFGYAARGFVFLLVAGLAARAAVFRFSSAEGAREALTLLRPNLIGRGLLAAVAVGLAGYVAWRFVQAITLPDSDRTSPAVQVRRIAFAATGLFYGLLAYTAAEMSIGRAPSAEKEEAWTAWLLEMPFGSTVLMVIGLGLVAGGLHTVYRGAFRRFVRLYEEVPKTLLPIAKASGIAGLISIGILLSVAGAYVVVAATRSEAYRIRDMGGVLDAAAASPHGPYLLAVAAIGIGAYAIHCFVLSRYRSVDAGN